MGAAAAALAWALAFALALPFAWALNCQLNNEFLLTFAFLGKIHWSCCSDGMSAGISGWLLHPTSLSHSRLIYYVLLYFLIENFKENGKISLAENRGKLYLRP